MNTDTPNKPVGRPNKVGRAFDSMAAASGALHIKFRTLQTIKGKGCNAFKWGKVYELALRRWIDDNLPTSDDDDYEPTETESLAQEAHTDLMMEGRTLAEYCQFLLARIKRKNLEGDPIPPNQEAS